MVIIPLPCLLLQFEIGMRILFKLLLVFLFFHLGLILYTNRALFFSKFDEPYWKDKYEHSQWKLPLSVRTLGDDGLYLYEGYRLMKGGDPTLLNAEVPPLGKYLIGLSILMFGNGHWYGFIINAVSLITLFLLSKTLLRNFLGALSITALVAFDPLITSQFPLTMLDSLQLLFLLLTFYFLLRFPELKLLKFRESGIVLAGLAFGLFSETKFPVLGAPIALLIFLFIRQKTKSLKSIVLFFIAGAVAYLLPYIQYFVLGHTFFDWLRVQKWIASFYLNSNLTPNMGSSITALLSGWYQNLFTKQWIHVPEWSPVWTLITPLAFISSLITLWKIFKRQEKIMWLPIAGFTLFSLIFFAIIPFWVRYLVLPLPFYYLMAVKFIKPASILLLFVIINLIITTSILFPTPARMLNQFAYNWRYGFFHDIYEDLSTNKNKVSREEFRRFGQQIFSQAEIESTSIEFDMTKLSRFASPQNIPTRITYFTRHLGSFTENKIIQLVKENGQWRISWDWNYLITNLDENLQLETTVVEAKRGSILASDKTPLAEDFESVMIWATPGRIDKSREEELLKLLWNLFDRNIPHIGFHQRIVGNSLPDVPIPLGVLYKPVAEELRTFPGITLTTHFGRRYRQSNIVTIGKVINTSYFECCSYLYTTTAYDGDNGIEKERNSELKGYNGGTLVIKDENGNIVRTILKADKRDGKDVQL